MATQEIKLDSTDILALDQCDASRLVASLTSSIASMTAQIARSQASLIDAKKKCRVNEVTVCVNHGLVVAPLATITRTTKQDGQYLVVTS